MKSNELLGTINGHKDRVNYVTWVPRTQIEIEQGKEEEIEIISASVDKTIKIWKKNNSHVWFLDFVSL